VQIRPQFFLVIVVTDRHTHTNQRQWKHTPSLSRG